MVDITITIPNVHALRLQKALELEYDMPDGTATIADAKQHIMQELKNFVRTAEQRAWADSAVIDDIEPT